MSKDKLTDYDSSASNNSDVGGVNTAEGMLPSKVNDAIRELMSHLADFSAGTTGVDVLNLQDDDNSASIKIQAPSAVTTTTTFTLPDGDGSAGQALLTDGAGALAWQSPASPNLIINGNMAVAQRGTSSTGVSGGGYETVDRFRTAYNGTPDELRVTHAQVADAPAGLTNSFKLTVTTPETTLAVDERVRFQQRIEAFNLQQLAFGTSSASAITLSFYVKSSIAGTYGVDLKNSDAGRSAAQSYTISVADTWEKKTLTFAGDTAGAFNNDNGEGLVVSWVLAAGTDYTSGTLATAFEATTNANLAPSGQENLIGTDTATWQITGVQLEAGSVANPVFQHESYAATLQKCQRYFYRVGGEIDGLGNYTGGIASGVMYGPTTATIMRPNPVTMRDGPDVTFDDAVANYTVMTSRTTNAVTAVGVNSSTVSTVRINVTCGATSNDGDGALLRSSRAQSTVSVDAEL